MNGARNFAVRDLEARLYRYLGIPAVAVSGDDSFPDHYNPGQEYIRVERLRHVVWELRQKAAKIGKIPSGYPRHIDLVMRLISALLPWYTRSLVQFGRQTAEAVRVIAEAVEQLAQRQRLRSSEWNRLRAADPTFQSHAKNPGPAESRLPRGL